MHELSIAMHLIELAEATAGRHGAARIRLLRARVGALSGVVPAALQSSFEIATQGTACEGAALEIEEIPLRVRCPKCNQVQAPPGPSALRCRTCGGQAGEIVTGQELELSSIEVDE